MLQFTDTSTVYDENGKQVTDYVYNQRCPHAALRGCRANVPTNDRDPAVLLTAGFHPAGVPVRPDFPNDNRAGQQHSGTAPGQRAPPVGGLPPRRPALTPRAPPIIAAAAPAPAPRVLSDALASQIQASLDAGGQAVQALRLEQEQRFSDFESRVCAIIEQGFTTDDTDNGASSGFDSELGDLDGEFDAEFTTPAAAAAARAPNSQNTSQCPGFLVTCGPPGEGGHPHVPNENRTASPPHGDGPDPDTGTAFDALSRAVEDARARWFAAAQAREPPGARGRGPAPPAALPAARPPPPPPAPANPAPTSKPDSYTQFGLTRYPADAALLGHPGGAFRPGVL